MYFDDYVPSFHGKDCPGDGHHFDENGNEIECCCDNCDYFLICYPEYQEEIDRVFGRK